jgi:hypothetical protein
MHSLPATRSTDDSLAQRIRFFFAQAIFDAVRLARVAFDETGVCSDAELTSWKLY